ncbi:MAG: hypothetical protein AB1589_19255 [Cyanobacteriota bacterium]
MLKSLRFAAAAFVVLLALTTACSSSDQSQDTSNSQGSNLASAQTNSSNLAAAMALASHLKEIDAKFYGTHWCPYCTKQKELFGKEAFQQINYIECDPAGKNAQPEVCQKANIEGFPTWEINGKQYAGLQSLQQLADISGYAGDRNFKN